MISLKENNKHRGALRPTWAGKNKVYVNKIIYILSINTNNAFSHSDIHAHICSKNDLSCSESL